MLPVPIVLFFGHLISIFPFKGLIFLSRIGAFFLIPFASTTNRMKKILGLDLTLKESLSLRYRRCASKLEGHIWHFKRELDVLDKTEVIGEDYFQQCKKSNRGILFVSIHHHSLRLFIFWLQQSNPTLLPFFIKGHPPQERARLYAFFRQHHELIFKGRLLHSGNDMRQAVRILQNKGSVLILQDNWGKKADPISFLKIPFRTPLGSLRLAEMSNSLILPFMAFNKSFSKKWTVRFWPPIDPQKENGKEKLISRMEEMVKSHPEEWELWNVIPRFD